MVHLCEWLTLSQVSSGGNNGKDKFKKRKKKEKGIKKKRKIGKKIKSKREGEKQTGGSESERREKEIFFFRFSLRSTEIGF